MSSKKPARPYSRTGLNALKAKVKLRGLGAIDQRTSAAKELLSFQTELVTDLGGEEQLSTQQRTLVNMAGRAYLFLNHVDGWLAQQESLINKRAKSVIPILRERQGLAEHLAKLLDRLGLERRKPPAVSLNQYVTRSDNGNGNGAHAPTPKPPAPPPRERLDDEKNDERD